MASTAYALPLKTEDKKEEKWISESNSFAVAVYYYLFQALIFNLDLVVFGLSLAPGINHFSLICS